MFNDELNQNNNNKSNRLLMGVMLLMMSVVSFLSGRNHAAGTMSLTRTGANCVLGSGPGNDGIEYMEEQGCTPDEISCLSDCYTRLGLINSPGVQCHVECKLWPRFPCWSAFDYAVRVNQC